VDKCIPELGNPHHPKDYGHTHLSSHEESSMLHDSHKIKMHRLGIFIALAIALHSFPEGFATFLSALKDPALGIAVAFAVAIHNIPVGISISVPIYYATGSKKKSFFYSFFSGLAEPIGAMVGFFLLKDFITPVIFGFFFAAVAGILVFIAIEELMPSAREYGEDHLPIYGFVTGMFVVALSLAFFTHH
jgi:ZIP family zinc transporter